jgi:hypothetical protein
LGGEEKTGIRKGEKKTAKTGAAAAEEIAVFTSCLIVANQRCRAVEKRAADRNKRGDAAQLTRAVEGGGCRPVICAFVCGMTSIQFQIDPDALRVIHGDRAEGFQRRRERERQSRDQSRAHGALDLAGAGARDEHSGEGLRMYNQMLMRERMGAVGGGLVSERELPRGTEGLRLAGAQAQFVAAGGRRLNLDK